jgi:hypothetical protein
MNLGVEAEFVGDEKRGRKNSLNVRRKSSLEMRCKTSAIDLRGYEWRLAKRVVLLKPVCRGLRRHIYRSRVQGQEKLSYFYYFGIILIPRVKIILENLELPF